MNDANYSVLVALLPFLFFFVWLLFLQREGARKLPRYMILLGFAVLVPLTICLLLFGFVLAAESPPDAMLSDAPVVAAPIVAPPIVVEPAAPEMPPPQVPQ